MYQSSSWRQSPERYSDTDSSTSTCSSLSPSSSSTWELTAASTWELPATTANASSPPITAALMPMPSSWEVPASSSTWETIPPSSVWNVTTASASSLAASSSTTTPTSSVWDPAASALSTSAASDYTPLEPISSFLSSSSALFDVPDPFPTLISDLCPSDPFHLQSPPTSLPQGVGERVEVCGSTYLLPSVLDIDSFAGGCCGAGAGGDSIDKDQLDKARRRQIKAELRKQRNKEAARKSNLNKKLIREQLENKSLELWEENLQLHQEIQNLTDKLRHFQHVRHAMHHVCHRQRSSPLAAACR